MKTNIWEWFGLSNSMINSGESHSVRSRECLALAKGELKALEAENARLRAQLDWTPVSIRPLPNDRSVTATVEHCTHKSRFVVELKKRDCVDGILSGVFKVIAWREIPQAWEGKTK